MPKWDIDLSDGTTVTVESESEPTDEEVLASVGGVEAQGPTQSQLQPLQPGESPFTNQFPEGWFDPERIALDRAMTAERMEPRPTAWTGFKENLADLVGDAGRGFLGVIPGAMKTAGAIAADPMSLPGSIGRGIMDFIAPGAIESPREPSLVSPEQNPLYRAGQGTQDFIEETFPPPQEPELSRSVAEGLGQVGSMLVGGSGVRALGAGTRGAAATAVGMGTAQEFDDAFTRSRQRGDDADTALAKSLGYATVAGLIENKIGAGRLLRQLFPSAAEAAKKLTAIGVGKKILGNFLAGGAEEGSQRVAQNWIVDEKPSMEGVMEEALPGAIIQGLVGLPSAGVGTRQAAKAAPAPAKETPTATIDEAAINRGLEKTAAEELAALPKVADADDTIAREVEKETGFKLVKKEQAGAMQIPTPEQLAAMPVEDQAIYAEIAKKNQPEWEFTNQENGLTFRAPITASKEQMLESFQKVAPNPKATPPEVGVESDPNALTQEDRFNLQEPLSAKTEAELAGVGSGPISVGPGAMSPAEAQPPKPFVTSNKGKVVDEERKARGLKPMMALERQTNPEAWDSAMRQIDENPQIQDELVAELTTNPRALTATENAILMHRRVDLRNEYEKALLRWREAFESDDMVRAAEESGRVRDWSSKLSDLEDITKATGAESGRSLQARKMMANEDYSLAAMELRAMEAKGRSLTNEEHVQLIKAQARILELENRLAELEGARESKEVDAATTETMKEVSTEAPKESKSKDFDVDREEKLLSGIKAKVDKGQTNDITSLVQQLARVFWRQGIRGREPMIDALHGALKTIIPEFSRDDTQRAFSGYGKFKPLSKEEIDVGLRDLRGQTQQVLKMEALEARKPLEKTGQERRVPSDEERRLIKQVNELKRKYGVVVTDPATQLKSALAARKTYYEHRIADLKHEIETRQRIVKSKTASPTDAELDLMIAERDRLQREHDTIFPKQEMSPEQQLKQAIAAAQRNLAHWEVRLENADKGIFSKRAPGRKVTSAELELIQAETAAIREHVKELKDLQNPKKTKEEIALQSLKTRMATRLADLKRRIATNDFTKKERKPVKLDAEALKLKAQVDMAKQEFDTKLEKDRWDKSTVFAKTKARVWGVYDLFKTLMATGEFSFVLRQGKGNFLESLVSPKRAVVFGKAIRAGLRAMASPTNQRIVEQEIFSDPMYPDMLRDKLYVPEHGSRMSKQEEFAMGRYSDAIPIINAFNRAAETFLKKIRADNYKMMVKSMTKTGTATPEEGKVIAQFINEQTGRGGLGMAEPAAIALNRVFFSPRYLMSRLQMASGHSLWSGTWSGTGRARKQVAASYARMLIGASLYYTALMMFFNRGDDDDDKATIEKDFRSSDAGKLKIGDTRLDPMAGIAQVLTMSTRTVTGEAKDTKGNVFPIVGQDVPFGKGDWVDYAARFARSKLHPALGGAIDLRMGENMVGEPVTVTSKLTESGPMTYYDIYEALRANNIEHGVAISLLALLGEGIQTHQKKK